MDVKYFVREKALYLGQVVQNFFVSFQWILLFILCHSVLNLNNVKLLKTKAMNKKFYARKIDASVNF